MKYHVGMLVEKSLIKVKTVTLHDLTEDMGKKFVTQGSAREAKEAIIQVLEDNRVRVSETHEWFGFLPLCIFFYYHMLTS